MVEVWSEKRVIISTDPTALARSVADRFLRKVAKRLESSDVAHVSLTGGSMGSAVLAAVSRHPKRDRVDWSRVHFWWSDERYLDRGHADRNETQAREALLDSVPVPDANIHAVAAADSGLGLDEAADAYAAELARFGAEGAAWPAFDVCFLGVGPDGHIASLFPDRAEIRVTDHAVLAVRDSPKPPSERVTMTRPVINSAQRVWMVLAGTDKASALGLALAGASYASVPAAGAKGRKQTMFFVDEDAAGNVPPELIDRE